jgi:hypothetical protein
MVDSPRFVERLAQNRKGTNKHKSGQQLTDHGIYVEIKLYKTASPPNVALTATGGTTPSDYLLVPMA